MIKKGGAKIPLWMNEGVAEYLADSWNTNTEMWVRDLAINSEQIPHLKLLNGYLAYRGGQSVWSFITKKWGDESIADFFYNLKISSNLKKSLKLTFGVDLDELSDQLDIHDDLEKQSKIIQSGIDSLKNLNAEYISMNELEQKNNNLKIFYNSY